MSGIYGIIAKAKSSPQNVNFVNTLKRIEIELFPRCVVLDEI